MKVSVSKKTALFNHAFSNPWKNLVKIFRTLERFFTEPIFRLSLFRLSLKCRKLICIFRGEILMDDELGETLFF